MSVHEFGVAWRRVLAAAAVSEEGLQRRRAPVPGPRLRDASHPGGPGNPLTRN